MPVEVIVTVFGGAQAILIGLVTYLGKIWLTRMEKNLEHNLKLMEKEVEAKFSIAIYANQRQFDQEFIFYKDVWKELAKIRLGIRRTLTKILMPEYKLSQNDSKMLISFCDRFYILIEQNEPFFPTEFRKELTLMRDLAEKWAKEIEENKTNKEWFLHQGSDDLMNLNVKYNNLNGILKTRLAELSEIKS